MSDLTPSTANPATPAARKAFIPLECNPELMTNLVHKLGLSPSLQFVDVYSLTDPDLLAFVPRPAHALLLVFPVSPSYEEHRKQEDAAQEEHDKSGALEDPVWFKQTIRNACGMIGILHAVSNGEARAQIQPDTPLSRILAEAIPVGPLDRARVLENSAELESMHKEAASQGDTPAPDAADDVELHYVCFIKSKKDNHLYELDGRRKGPLDRGHIEDDDVLGEKAREVVQGFIEREKESGRVDFSLVALVPGFD